MKDGYIDDFDILRVVSAVEDELVIKPIEQPRVVVQNQTGDDTTAHVVNLDTLECTCEDFEYNCKPKMKTMFYNNDGKQKFRVVLEKHRML
jgi:hypothetical protein